MTMLVPSDHLLRRNLCIIDTLRLTQPGVAITYWLMAVLDWIDDNVPPIKWLRHRLIVILHNLVVAFSPPSNITFTEKLDLRFIGKIFIYTFLVTLFFAYFMNGLLSYFQGTYCGIEPKILYYCRDKWNLFIYMVLAPSYTAFSVCIICVTAMLWNSFRDIYSKVDKNITITAFFDRYRVVTFSIFYILVPVLLISNYANTIPRLPHPEGLHWFFYLNSGVVTYHFGGYYYIITNAIRLLIVMVSVSCFLSVSVEVFRMGSILRYGRVDDAVVESIKERMSVFSTIYVLMKFYTAVILIHLLVWGSSPLSVKLNIAASVIALFIIAVYLVAVPRHFIEIKIYEYRKRKALRESRLDDANKMRIDDIRSQMEKHLSGLANRIIFSLFGFGVLAAVIKVGFPTNERADILRYLDYILQGISDIHVFVYKLLQG